RRSGVGLGVDWGAFGLHKRRLRSLGLLAQGRGGGLLGTHAELRAILERRQARRHQQYADSRRRSRREQRGLLISIPATRLPATHAPPPRSSQPHRLRPILPLARWPGDDGTGYRAAATASANLYESTFEMLSGPIETP